MVWRIIVEADLNPQKIDSTSVHSLKYVAYAIFQIIKISQLLML